MPPALALRRLVLTDFRGYPRLDWRPAARLTAIVGPNGAGKTNLLEAVSLLVPGRGLRGARIAEMARRDGAGGFAVAARLDTPEGKLEAGTAFEPGSTRRRYLLDGAPPRNQAEIAARIAAVWITPAMDGLFREGGTARRRFLDRLVWAFDPGHAREVASYEAALSQRNRLLAQGGADPAWLAGLEDGMARHGIAVAAARRSLATQLDRSLAEGRLEPFPAARLAVRCDVSAGLETGPALVAENAFRELLARSRKADAAAGSAQAGPHRAELEVTHAAKNLPAALASTGEQKALLVAIVLAHAGLIAELRGVAPLLLLDEPATHLDEPHRQALFGTLAKLPAQAFMTATDAMLFRPLSGRLEMVSPGPEKLAAMPGFPAPEPAFLL